MDNFKKHKTTKSNRRSVDGFVRRKITQPNVGDSVSRNRSNRSRRPATIDDFAASEGFHETKNSSIKTDKRKTSTGRNSVFSQSDESFLELTLDDPKKAKRKHRFKRLRRKKTKVVKSLLILVVAFVLVGGYLSAKGYITARNIFKGGADGAVALNENVNPSQLNGEGDGRVNILLLGKGGEGHTAPDLTDTILIVSIDPIQNEAAIVSIPRDLYVKTKTYGSMKINAVYTTAKNYKLAYGASDQERDAAEKRGLKAIEEIVEQSIGIPIHYNAMVDFAGFKQAVDAVGGVTINVEDPVYEVMQLEGQNYILNVKEGEQSFDGFRALAYSRSRYTSLRGDFDRSERQRLIMVALKEKVLSLGTFSNPVKISQLLDAFGGHVQTNLSLGEIRRLYDIANNIQADNISSIGLADPPNNYVITSNIGGLSVVIPRAGVNDFSDIRAFIRSTLVDGFIRDESAKIAVFNGTGLAGLAGRTAAELQSYGYIIDDIADAPTKDYQQNILVDLRSGSNKFTQAYLEKRFGLSAVSELPDINILPGEADFVIIIGQNEVNRLEN